MKRQITFEGKYCQSSAIEWLQDLEKCFEIKKAKIISYNIKKRYDWQQDNKRCKVEVNYK